MLNWNFKVTCLSLIINSVFYDFINSFIWYWFVQLLCSVACYLAIFLLFYCTLNLSDKDSMDGNIGKHENLLPLLTLYNMTFLWIACFWKPNQTSLTEPSGLSGLVERSNGFNHSIALKCSSTALSTLVFWLNCRFYYSSRVCWSHVGANRVGFELSPFELELEAWNEPALYKLKNFNTKRRRFH